MGIHLDRGNAHTGIHPWADFRIFKTVGISLRCRNGMPPLIRKKWNFNRSG